MLIVDSGADPWVVRHADAYLYCHVVDDAAVHVRTSAALEGLDAAVAVEVRRPPAHLRTLRAPELHRLDGRWWISVAADDGDNASHRMRVPSADAPTGPYVHEGQIATEDDHWPIDGTVLGRDGSRYFVWSGWEEPHRTEEQRLYSARMSSPTTLVGPRVCIAVPSEPWEVVGMPVIERPVACSAAARRRCCTPPRTASPTTTASRCSTSSAPTRSTRRRGASGVMVVTPDELVVPEQRTPDPAALPAA